MPNSHGVMGHKFYKKLSPATSPALANGMSVRFNTLDDVVGYYATAEAYIQAQFQLFAQEQRYGITEIDYAEFDRDYLQKKNLSTRPARPYREEFGSGGRVMSDTIIPPSVNAAVGVEGTDVPKKPVVTVSEPAKAETPGTPKAAEFKPKTAKRATMRKSPPA